MTPEQQRAIAIASARRRMESGGDDFAARAASLDPTDLSVARSKNDAFGEYLRNEAKKPREGETPQQRDVRLYGQISTPHPGALEGMTRGFLQGGTFGLGDEIVGAGAAAVDAMRGDASFGDAYNVRVANERSKLKNFREDSPVLSFGSEMVGAIPTAVMTSPAAIGGSLASRLAISGGTGLGQGMLYGFNSGEGGVGNRMKNAATTGAIGGLTGVAAVPVSAAVGNLASRLMTGRAAKSIGMSRPAYEIIRDISQADDSLSGAGAQRINAAGPGAMLADAGPSQMALLDAAAQRTGPAARLATERVTNRVNDASRSMGQTLDDVLGQPQGPISVARDISRSTAGARGDAYRAAYGQAINYADDTGRAIEGVLGRVPNRVMQQAINDANEMMVANGERNAQIMFSIADDGTVTMREMPNVIQLDYIKRALGNMGSEAVDNFGRPTAQGGMYSSLARDLRDSISAAVPGYSDALRLGADKIAMDNGLRLGREILRPGMTREMVIEAVDNMSDPARQMAFSGLRSSIDDALANVKMAITDPNVDARESMKLIKDLSTRANREKVSALLGNDMANRLFSEIDQAAQAFGIRAGMAQNSKTFARTAINDTIESSTGDGVISALRSGDPMAAARNAAASALGGTAAAKKRASDRVVMELADMLTRPNPQGVLSQLETIPPQILAGSQKARNLAELLLRRNAGVTAPLSSR